MKRKQNSQSGPHRAALVATATTYSQQAKWVLVLLVAATIVTLSERAQADCFLAGDQVCYTGVFPQSPVIAEIGNTVVTLPATTFTNNTTKPITFRIDWDAGTLGNGSIQPVTLDPQTQQSFSNLSFQIDTTGVAVGTYDIQIAWSAVEQAHCDPTKNICVSVVQTIQLVLVLPAQLREIIQIPIRFCAIEGSPQAEGQPAGNLASGRRLFSLLRRMNDQVWLPEASILFRPAGGLVGIPVVKAQPPDGFKPGDVSAADPSSTTNCESAWAMSAPDQKGVVVVNARIVVSDLILGGGGTTGGSTPGPDRSLWVLSSEKGTGQRGDDLCGHPRHLAVSDVTPVLRSFVYDQALFQDPVTDVYVNQEFEPARVLAHELGHALMLGHGNGLDDNMDGLLPPDIGRRRFDFYCDPMMELEDRLTPFTTCELSDSLMKNGTNCTNLQPLQREMAREVAKLVPGAVITDPTADPAGQLVAPPGACPPTCTISPSLVLKKVEISETPARQATAFAVTTVQLPQSGSNSYVVYADLDNNANTGCGTPLNGVPVGLHGAEIATEVDLAIATDGTITASPHVWKCNGSSWAEVTNGTVRATAYAQPLIIDGASAVPSGPGIITIELPDSLRGPAGDPVRLQSVSVGKGASDSLPGTGNGGVVSLTPPVLPTCSVSTPVVAPGSSVTVAAASLPPHGTADLFLGDRQLGTTTVDGSGNISASVSIPATSAAGVQPLDVRVENSSASAPCALVIKGSAVTPATTATLSPAPNVNGWNNGPVTLNLAAVDVAGGPGIKEIDYSATGAQPIASTAQAGASASFTITHEGQTSVQFFAINAAGLAENAQTFGVNIDETPPTIAFSGNQGVYGLLDTVKIVCTPTDNLSGVAVVDCKGANGVGYTFPPGVNTITAAVSDYAGNVSHGSTTFTIRVTFGDVSKLTTQFRAAGCIDSEGVANAITSKLATAQAYINAGNIQQAKSVLNDLLGLLQAQNGKHIHTQCTMNGTTSNPDAVLIAAVQALLASL
jgi:hypothetical protein